MSDPITFTTGEVDALRSTISFLGSVIRSGEPFTEHVQQAMDNAYQRLSKTPKTKRTVTIDFHSHVTDALWEDALAEIVEAVEQIACDYAAAAPDDDYAVSITEEVPANG